MPSRKLLTYSFSLRSFEVRCLLPNIVSIVSELVSPLRLPRDVAGLGAVLPPPVHDYVSLREGSALPSVPRGACVASLSQR